MNRISSVVFSLAMSLSVAHADTSPPPARAVAPSAVAGFVAWVRAVAEERHLKLADWWLVNLDGDLALERVAVLCGEGDVGEVLVEKDAAHRWNLVVSKFVEVSPTFGSCNDNDNDNDDDDNDDERRPVPAIPEKLAKRYPKYQVVNGIVLYTHHSGGYSEEVAALRRGQLVIVSEEWLEDSREGDTPKKTNWDKRVNSKHGRYPTIDKGDAPGAFQYLLREQPAK